MDKTLKAKTNKVSAFNVLKGRIDDVMKSPSIKDMSAPCRL